jgi:hypothetical protein
VGQWSVAFILRGRFLGEKLRDFVGLEIDHCEASSQRS